MSERDRLIELLNTDMSGCDGDYAEELADYLIANGVIVPPCKVGDTLKEFAEKLKNKIKTECNPYGKPTFDYDTSLAIMRYIDNLVKEMVGEKNE